MWFLISASDLERYLDEGRDICLVDIRDEDSFLQEHIRGAVNVPAEKLPDLVRQLPPGQLIVLYCYHGPQSMLAARELARCGYRVADLYGGIQAYRSYRGKYLAGV